MTGTTSRKLAIARRVAARSAGEFSSIEGIGVAGLYFAASKASVLTGQRIIVSHGWLMEQKKIWAIATDIT